MTALGLFGGTFAPLHNGHLRLALEARERLGLERVHLLPSARPPHRTAPGVSAERRLEWARLAIGDEPGLIADDRELRREALSYTYDTLADFRREFPSAPLMLLLGHDAANTLHTWHRWQELLQLAHLVFIERPGQVLNLGWDTGPVLRERHAHRDELRHKPAGLWTVLSIPALDISSTRIRQLLKAGRSLRGLVPEAVIASFTTEDIRLLTYDEEPAIE